MKTRLVRIAVIVMFLGVSSTVLAQDSCDGLYGQGENRFSVATGSPGELGLVEVLAEVFSAGTDTSVCWKKAGSGESLKMLREKSVDMVMVHAPAAEKKAVDEGWAANRILIGSNAPQEYPAHRLLPKRTGRLHRRGRSSFPGGTIRERTRRRWISGRGRISLLPANGML